jgi:hypothetical protein
MDNDNKILKYKHFIVVAFFTALTLILGTNTLYQGDYFWHLKAGEYIANNHVIPIHDVFSWYGVSQNLDWFSHEWLSELIFYIIYSVFGHLGNIILSVLVTAFVIGFLYVKNRENFGKNLIVSMVWFLIFSFEIKDFTNPRPYMFSYILLMITLYILQTYRIRDTKSVWALPIISIIWANIHGGSSSMTYILIFIVIITGLFNFEFLKIKSIKLSAQKLKVLSVNFILSILAIALNPKGFSMILYPYVNMNDKLPLSVISEWESPDIKNSEEFLIFVILGLAILLLLIIKEQIDLYDLVITLAFTYLTLKSVRFVVLFLIAVTPIVLTYAKGFTKIDLWEKLLLFMTMLTIVMICMYPKSLRLPMSQPINLVTQPSTKAVDIIKEQKPQRLLNDYGWGGYLIYNNIPVFIDGRADMYSKNIFPEYLAVVNVGTYTKKIINKYNFDMVIIPAGSTLDVYLSEWSDYQNIYRDDTTVLYKKVN